MPYDADTERTDPLPTQNVRGDGYHSALDDNRRTTQQVVVPRRSGIHAVMQRGPRLALIVGATVALVLFLVSVIGQSDPNSANNTAAQTPLPTLTLGGAPRYTTSVIVTGTGDSGLYLRAAAGRDAAILATIPEGARLGVTGAVVTNDGAWLPVETADGVVGWVAADYTREE